MEERGNILMYQTVDGQTAIEVVLSNETVWLTIDKMADLFQRNKSTISRHIKNILESGELRRTRNVEWGYVMNDSLLKNPDGVKNFV